VCSWVDRFTGKERDSESGNDYFEARYYSSAMGRFMSPDWSAQQEPVPYAKLDDPQSLNLYSYVQNNPLSNVDVDGHQHLGCSTSECAAVMNKAYSQAASSPYVQGTGKIALGVGLVATAAGGDVPGGVAGALLVGNTVLGGTATAVSGTAQIIGTATNTNTTSAQDALSATSSGPGLVTAASGGNLNAAQTVTTITNAATLATDPKGAVKNVATGIDAAQTVKETGSLINQTVDAVRSSVSGALAPAHSGPLAPAPAPPRPPACGSTPGAC
jgi:RHS repeat-associated protein